MRLLLACLGVAYGINGWCDTALVETPQKQALEKVLIEQVPEWIGTSVRIAELDHTD